MNVRTRTRENQNEDKNNKRKIREWNSDWGLGEMRVGRENGKEVLNHQQHVACGMLCIFKKAGLFQEP